MAYDPQYPAWQHWQPGQHVDPYDIPDEILDKWIETEPGKVGYSRQGGCYCWGYRPKNRPVTVDGRRWVNQLPPTRGWKICEWSCPCPVPPPPPPPPPCPTCPTLDPTTCTPSAGEIKRSKNWLWLVGFSVLIVGVYGVRRTMAIRRE